MAEPRGRRLLSGALPPSVFHLESPNPSSIAGLRVETKDEVERKLECFGFEVYRAVAAGARGTTRGIQQPPGGWGSDTSSHGDLPSGDDPPDPIPLAQE